MEGEEKREKEGGDEEGVREKVRGKKTAVEMMEKGVIEDEEEEEGVERRGMEEQRSLYSTLTSHNDSALALAPLPRSFWLTCGQEGDQWDGECAVTSPSHIPQSNSPVKSIYITPLTHSVPSLSVIC